MAYTEFYCDPVNGNNLNAGSTSGSAAYTGVGDSDGTSVFTPSDGSTPASSVNVGDFASVYVTSGATVAVFVGRVTNVAAGVNGAITVSTSAKSGTFPANSSGAHTITCKVGGAWLGPNGSTTFPFSFITSAPTNVSGNIVRVNFLNTIPYAVTAQVSINSGSSTSSLVFQGYSSSPGDLGRACIAGPQTGASFNMVSINGNGMLFADFNLSFNGSTGSSSGMFVAGTGTTALRVSVYGMRGHGINITNGGTAIACETYHCNTSNTANIAGLTISASGGVAINCISHDNTGSNNNGFFLSSGDGTLINCISFANQVGLLIGTTTSVQHKVLGCSFVSNVSHGATAPTAQTPVVLEDCIFVSNGTGGSGYGINVGSTNEAILIDCAFYNNHDGTTNGAGVNAIGTITLTGSPFNDSANGDFSLNNTASAGASCRGAGLGTFLLAASGSGSVNGATNASPIVISTTAAHGLTSGAVVTIASVGGNTNANGTWTISVVDSTHFSLLTSSGNSAYTSGGTWAVASAYSKSTTAYPDVGAVQHQDAGGGGGGGSILRSSIIQGMGVLQ